LKLLAFIIWIFSLASFITIDILEFSNRVSYSPSSFIESNEKLDY
jgi:hypothetical protein